MGTRSAEEIDNWLQAGGLVLAASDRAARALRAAFHARRRAQGLTAWPEPEIHSLSAFLQAAWQQRTQDDRLLLNPAQEQSLWARIVGQEKTLATLLDRPRHSLAALAADAHSLLCSHAPRLLQPRARAGWSQDAAAFSTWLTDFDHICLRDRLLSPSRLPLELISLLQVDSVPRPPLLLVGFDRVLPVQRELLQAWGQYQLYEPAESPSEIRFHAAPDAASELDACALWCMRSLAADPSHHILVLTQEIATRRGQIERAFLRAAPSAARPPFEFSLGIPLAGVPLPCAAHLLLRWLTGPLEEHEIDWLLASGFLADAEETAALQIRMRQIRSRSLQRTHWTLQDFLAAPVPSAPSPSFSQGFQSARDRVLRLGRRPQSPLEWAALVPQLLADLSLPGERHLSSAQFQALQRWQQALDTAASLAFDNQPIDWSGFLSALARILDDTLFSTESANAPILIAGPAESAGLSASAVWFIAADEDTWPARASAHPLLPLAIQRDFAMPHATPQLDWDLANAITRRLLSAAPVLHFSFARQKDDSDARPSRLILACAGAPQPLAADLTPAPPPEPLAVAYADDSRIPLAPGTPVRGGAALLTAQSQCPFRAFAVNRLDAQSWEPAQPGLTAPERGQLLHDVLHSVWGSPPPNGLRSLQDLLDCPDLPALVSSHVQSALRASSFQHVRARVPRACLELEALRLQRLVAEWLAFEATRLPFTVEQTEAAHTAKFPGLSLRLRLDRLDRLSDGSLLVIDYKSGLRKPSEWDLPRPNDVQLPTYALFALPQQEPLGGLVFAQVRTSKPDFAGRLRDARATLNPDLKGTSTLVRNPLTAQQLDDWRSEVLHLAHNFLDGRAEVDPRDPVHTCERCDLQSLCRIAERQILLDDDAESEEDTDE